MNWEFYLTPNAWFAKSSDIFLVLLFKINLCLLWFLNLSIAWSDIVSSDLLRCSTVLLMFGSFNSSFLLLIFNGFINLWIVLFSLLSQTVSVINLAPLEIKEIFLLIFKSLLIILYALRISFILNSFIISFTEHSNFFFDSCSKNSIICSEIGSFSNRSLINYIQRIMISRHDLIVIFLLFMSNLSNLICKRNRSLNEESTAGNSDK